MIENLRNTLLSKFTVKQLNTAANVVMYAGLIINTLEILNNPVPAKWNWPVTIIATLLVVLGAVFQALFVRCPVCGDSIKGKVSKLPDRCPNCNHDLNKLAK